MHIIDAAEFQEHCLEMLDQLDVEGFVITKLGRPVVRVIPFEQQEADLIGSLRHKIKVTGDIYSTGLPREASAQS